MSLRVDVEGDEAHLRQVTRGSSSATLADVSSEELFRIHRGIGEIDSRRALVADVIKSLR